MYLAERLEELCQDDCNRKDRLSQWHVIQQETVKKLGTVCTHFPHFSKHDSSHSVTIGEHVGKLLGIERVNKLSCSDIMMLLACFYLHDVGMAVEYEEIYDRLTSKDFQEMLEEISNNPDSELHMTAKRLRGFSSHDMSYGHSIDVYNDVVEIIETIYRSEHAKRSFDYIRNCEGVEQCFGIRCKRLLANICELHQGPICDIMVLPYKENGLFGDYFHPRFIAAMLCLGDLMDLDTDRFDEVSLKSVPPMPRISKLHLRKHESVTHYLVDENEIHIKSNTDDISVYNVMRQWLDWIQEACEYISLHWSEIAPEDFGNAPRLIERELLLNGEKIHSELANLRYQISGRRMYKLMEGGGIYRNKLVCIREILQNAVDATIYRLFDEGVLNGSPKEVLKSASDLNWDDYKIEGSIEKVDDTHVGVRVRDRGIGVSEEDIYRIAQVSNRKSKHTKELLKKMPDWIRPSGTFGIGLQSIFLLTDEFTMISKTIDEPPKEIVFQSSANGTGYIIVKKHEGRFTQGTEVKFTVDLTKMSAEELRCSNYYYRRKILSVWFLKRAILDYSNQLPAIPPAREARKKKADSVPMDLSITDYRTGKNIQLLRVDAFLSLKGKEIDIRNGFIQTRLFFPELNCHLECDIRLKHSNNHTYGKFEREFSYLHNTVLYRHEYVTDGCLELGVLENIPLLPYIDWRIDLVGGNADEVLNLNRNIIREEYAQQFLTKLLKAIKKTICEVIDYLLADVKGENRPFDIGDTILLIYQFARQYGYKQEELYKEYNGLFKAISIDNYVAWDNQELRKEKLTELVNETMYFVVGRIDEKLLTKSMSNSVKSFNGDAEKLICIDKCEGVHILNHRAKSTYVALVKGEYLELVEAVPFEYSDPMKLAIDMDDIILLNKIIRMLKLRIRGLPVLHGYELLATPVNPESFSIRHYVHAESYLIELPFGEYEEKIYGELAANGYVPNACGKYLKKIMESELYKANIEYICSYHKVNTYKIGEMYKELIERMLNLLADEECKDYNQSVLQKYLDPRISEYIFNGRSELEANGYLSTIISV